MNQMLCERTSRWVNGTVNTTVKPELEDSKDSGDVWDAGDAGDAPLDFSSKKCPQPTEMAVDDDADSNSGSSQRSRADSPPASMVYPHNLTSPLIRQVGPLDNLFPNFNGQKLPSFPFTTARVAGKPVKHVRPFKAYPKDSLALPMGFYGMPMNFGLMEAVNNSQFFGPSEEAFLQYKRNAEALCQANGKKFAPVTAVSGKPIRTGRRSSSNGLVSSSNQAKSRKRAVPAAEPPTSVAPAGSPTGVADSTGVALTASPQSGARSLSKSPSRDGETDKSGETGAAKPQGNSVPEEVKDAAYWERRRKNNEAAKRSRDSRRMKEDEIALKATILERENLRLRMELKQLKTEITKLRALVYGIAQ